MKSPKGSQILCKSDTQASELSELNTKHSPTWIKDIDRFDAIVHHPDCSVEHPHQVTGGVAIIRGQHSSSILSDGNQELVQAHTGIYGNFAAKIVLDLIFFDSSRSHISNQFRQSKNTHDDINITLLIQNINLQN